MSAALDTRGLKRVCAACGTRYYDFNKRPVKCPNCAVEFTPEVKLKTRRGRVANVAEVLPAKLPHADENIEQIEQDDDVVGLDDVAKEEAAGEDIDMDDDAVESLEDLDEDLDEDLEVDIDKE